jgi:hypothetical protein
MTHECSVCHTTDAWCGSWQWFGSYKDLDDGLPVVRTCSDKCRAQIAGKESEILAQLQAPHIPQAKARRPYKRRITVNLGEPDALDILREAHGNFAGGPA